mmetsp:Transcript_1270/g.2596  ORF Transcript_1270/g.2596 Transcript_1270/m.2596 type:complete len:288 (+) Transcript_1270:1105-1968(+)
MTLRTRAFSSSVPSTRWTTVLARNPCLSGGAKGSEGRILAVIGGNTGILSEAHHLTNVPPYTPRRTDAIPSPHRPRPSRLPLRRTPAQTPCAPDGPSAPQPRPGPAQAPSPSHWKRRVLWTRRTCSSFYSSNACRPGFSRTPPTSPIPRSSSLPRHHTYPAPLPPPPPRPPAAPPPSAAPRGSRRTSPPCRPRGRLRPAPLVLHVALGPCLPRRSHGKGCRGGKSGRRCSEDTPPPPPPATGAYADPRRTDHGPTRPPTGHPGSCAKSRAYHNETRARGIRGSPDGC